MKKYEVIKNMNKQELIGFLYAFLLPWVSGEKDEAVKKELWDKLDAFLSQEVKDNGTTTSKNQP